MLELGGSPKLGYQGRFGEFVLAVNEETVMAKMPRILALFGLSLVLPACSEKDCHELCEESAEECDQDEQACKEACDTLDQYEGCGGEVDEYISCLNDEESLCSVDTDCEILIGSSNQPVVDCAGDCAAETEAMYECFVDYCLAQPGTPGCDFSEEG